VIEVLCGQDKKNKVLAMPHANTSKQRKEKKKLIEFKWLPRLCIWLLSDSLFLLFSYLELVIVC
jgi:hypothetical protein